MREPKFRKKSSKKLKSKHFRKKHSTRRTNKLRGGSPPPNQQNQQNKPNNPEPLRPSRQKARLQRSPSPDNNNDNNNDNDNNNNNNNNDNNDNNDDKTNNNNNRQGGRYGIGFFHGPKKPKPRDSVQNEELYERLLGEHHTKNAKTSKTSTPFMDRLKKTMRFFHKKQGKKR